MTTINATKGEFVNLINGLFAVQEMKGKEFGLIVSKNITAIRKELKSVEDAGTPSEEFLKLAEQVNVLANENTDESKKKIEQLEKDNQELVDKRRAEVEKVKEMLQEDISLDLELIPKDTLPEDVTAKQINAIEMIIE
tara:strand:+ start:155 stop:568 length:414 start_codon:yes stop_codon:yes gene_type:complete